MLRRLTMSIALALVAMSAAAQTPSSTLADLEKALAAAQASAHRPGDPSLDCPALESELVAVAKNPALQAYVAKSGAHAQEKMAEMEAAASRGMGTQMAMTMLSSVLPGAAWAGQAAMAAEHQAMQAQAARNMERMMQQAQEMIPVMPVLMRGQRVVELAQARDCAWVRDAMRQR